MTIIKQFDVPHIVRFGMTDHDRGKSGTEFWRNGVHFVIQVDQDDVAGTDFERQWKLLLDPNPISLHESRWSELCGLVILHSMDLLQTLAPNTLYWTSLGDYLYAKSYIIMLHGTPKSGVIAQVIHGPTSTCAYDMQPAAWNTFTVSDDLPVFDCWTVTPLDHEHNLEKDPEKVRLPDGKVAFFLPCKTSVRSWDWSGFVDVNESHQSIVSYLLLHSLKILRSDYLARIPKVLGVLSDSGHPAADTQREDGKRVAGILLEWIDGFRLINSGLNVDYHNTMRNESNHEKWRQQVVQLVRELHRHGVSALGVDISPFDIIIDQNDGHAWLTGFINTEVSEGYSQGDVNESEQTQLKLVFDQWLKGEANISEPNPQEVRNMATSRWFAILDSLPTLTEDVRPIA